MLRKIATNRVMLRQINKSHQVRCIAATNRQSPRQPDTSKENLDRQFMDIPKSLEPAYNDMYLLYKDQMSFADLEELNRSGMNRQQQSTTSSSSLNEQSPNMRERRP